MQIAVAQEELEKVGSGKIFGEGKIFSPEIFGKGKILGHEIFGQEMWSLTNTCSSKLQKT